MKAETFLPRRIEQFLTTELFFLVAKNFSEFDLGDVSVEEIYKSYLKYHKLFDTLDKYEEYLIGKYN